MIDIPKPQRTSRYFQNFIAKAANERFGRKQAALLYYEGQWIAVVGDEDYAVVERCPGILGTCIEFEKVEGIPTYEHRDWSTATTTQ